ncbi:MAG: hypothetical protein K6F59_01080 [Gammaproteobacteria bacterium]|nr:hypothetical protein [Gammaproteobacteria bacterium]
MEDKLIKKYKLILLLDLIVLFLSTAVDIFLFIYTLSDVINNAESLVKYAEIVSFIIIFIALVFITIKTFKHYMVKDNIINHGKEKEVKIGTLGVYIMILAIYMFSYALIKAISMINNYNVFTLVIVLSLIVPAGLNAFISVMTLKLSASFYQLKEKPNA